MIPLTSHKDSAILVVGLGRSGLSASKALAEGGARVSVWDDNAKTRERAASEGLAVVDIDTVDMTAFDDIMWSPGVPHTHPAHHPLADKAKAAGLTLRCDVDYLATAQPDATYVGITGTNGKSTTTALAGHIFEEAGKTVAVGGNLGTPALDLAPIGAEGCYVLELSSYQTELTPNLSCATAVLLNIAPDHLDRHGGLNGYIAAKEQVLDRLHSGSTAIVGCDDWASQAILDRLTQRATHRVVGISGNTAPDASVFVADGVLQDSLSGSVTDQIDLTRLTTLPGQHNWQNAAASYAIARTHGISADTIERAFKTFPGLPHRQEIVGTAAQVTFVNDSKATNAAATEKALSCYGHVYWIAGGQAKEDGIESLEPLFGRIRGAFLIGDAADDFATTLDHAGVPTHTHSTLEDAVQDAGEQALQDSADVVTVLLSPACASFDMFSNFEQRGDAFRAAVHAAWPETINVVTGGHA